MFPLSLRPVLPHLRLSPRLTCPPLRALSSSPRPRPTAMATAAVRGPPRAKKVRHEMVMHGDVRVDDYYWLRDDSRSSPDVLSYLKEENDYTDHVMADTKHFEDLLFNEIKGRIKEDDISAPIRKGSYYYYTRTLEGKEYVQYCRRRIPESAPPISVNDVMPIGPDAPPEHVILDENIKAQAKKYYSIGAFKVSPNDKFVAYAEDTKGDEVYTVHVIDAHTGNPIEVPLRGVTSNLAWAGNGALVYITMDEILRPDKVWLHKLNTDQSSDQCLYHEKDDMFSLDLVQSESKEYIFVGSESKTTRFVLYLDISKVETGLLTLTPRVKGIDTSVSHRGNHFFITKRSDEYYNSELLVCPLHDVSKTTVLLSHRESVKIQGIKLFKDHLVVYERENGLPKVTVYELPPIGAEIKDLGEGRSIIFVDPIYSVDAESSEYLSCILRYSYSSLKTPPSIFDYDMSTGISVLKKVEPVLGGFNSSNYVTERKWALASDGVKIPISILYRKNFAKLDGSDPLFLYGYGSYEICIDPSFKASRLSLVDRGFIFVIAHIRGGGELGRQWYENGKLLKKKSTFTDFITCAEYLITNNYCTSDKLCISGGSAGGLLMGAVLNMRPDLFKVAVTRVPFVDVLTTMLDASIPLTTSEWEEWGDPRMEQFYFYMKSITKGHVLDVVTTINSEPPSRLQEGYELKVQVKPQNYPHILVTTGLNDPRVMYSEPAKFVAKLREMKTDNNILLFKCELAAGHFSKSGRFEYLREDAFVYTFILKALDMIPVPAVDSNL